MQNIFEFTAFVVTLVVLCIVGLFVYIVIGKKKAGKIILAINAVLILHVLLIFLTVYASAIIPAPIFRYGMWLLSVIF